MCIFKINNPLFFVLSAVSFFLLLTADASSSQMQLLPRRGMQETAICAVEGRCMNKVVECPTECPEMMPRGGRQRKVCAVDCAIACAATCKKLTHTTMASNASSIYHALCNKTENESLCVSIVKSDPRKYLKSSPQGLVVIIVNAAQAKANATRLFIIDALIALQNRTTEDYDKSKAVFENCLVAYKLDWLNKALQVDMQQVSDKQRCGDLYESLRTVVLEVTYDCEWDRPSPISPPLNRMFTDVELLAAIIGIAQRILSLIGCGGSL